MHLVFRINRIFLTHFDEQEAASMRRPVRWFDLITFNIYYLGLTTLSQTNAIIVPLLVQHFIGESQKGAYLGSLRLWSLMVALLSQAVWGMLSDRSTLPGGRRRPFILIGTLGDLVFFSAIGFSAGLAGTGGFWFLTSTSVMLAISSNMAHAAMQGLIPDLVPEKQRGKFSAVKAVLELPVPLILVSFTVGKLVASGNLWGAILMAMGVLVLVLLLTMLVPETRQEKAATPFNIAPILRLFFMASVFTAVILGAGWMVRLTGSLFAGSGSILGLVILQGLAGLAAMVIAIALGVWISVRISIGSEAARRYPSFTWWVVNRLAFLVGVVNLSIFAIYFMQARLGYEQEQAAGPATTLMMVVGIFILLSALPSGWLADRFGRRLLVGVSGITAAAGTLIALSSANLAIIYIGGCLIGAATGLFFTANWALGTDLVPKGEAGRYLGISNLAGAGAGAVGAYIGGPIADYFTVLAPGIPGLGYVVLFAIYGMLFLLSVAALAKVRETGTAEAPGSPLAEPAVAR
jgi:MFS family permease